MTEKPIDEMSDEELMEKILQLLDEFEKATKGDRKFAIYPHKGGVMIKLNSKTDRMLLKPETALAVSKALRECAEAVQYPKN